jgi:transposase InsO family protein
VLGRSPVQLNVKASGTRPRRAAEHRLPLVERTTRFTLLLHLPRMTGHGHEARVKNGPALAGHGAEALRDAITRTIITLPEQLRRSLTWDQGAEPALHARLKIDAGVQVYFCDPHSPWQRGTTRTPTGCYASTSKKAPISACTAPRRFRPWRPPSTPGPERRSIGKRLQRRLTSCFYRPTKTVLRRPLESAQYAARAYRQVLDNNGMLCSMSWKGDCWDNAPMESFFGSMKTELTDDTVFETRQEAKGAIFSFIEAFYNRRRLHSAIGYRSPADREQIAAAA